MEPDSKSVGSEATGGCGLKKTEETEEAPAVDVVAVGQSELAYEDDSDEVVDTSEDPEVIFARIRAKFEARARESEAEVVYEDDSDESDSDEDPEMIFAKIKAKFDASTRELRALFPEQTYGDCFLEEDSHDDDKH